MSFAGSSYNCSDNHAIITDKNWTLLCPPVEEVALQASLIIDDELPALSSFEYIGMVVTCAWYPLIHNYV